MTQVDTLSELKNKSWLSEWIREEFKKQYPQLAPATRRQKFVSRLTNYLRLPITWAFIAFVVFFIINESLLAKGIIFAIHKLDAQSMNEVLGSYIDGLAAMIGIVIPLVILVIEFLGRDSGDVIDVYLDKTEIKTVALSALGVLALHGATKLIAGADLIPIGGFYFYTLVLLAFLDLAVLFGVALALNKVRLSLNNDFFIQAFLERIKKDIKENQREEVEYRYSRIVQINIARVLELRRSFLPQAPSNLPPNATAVVASKSGVITDIHIPKWITFGQSLKEKLRGDPAIKGYVVRFVGDVVSGGDPIAYVALAEGQDIGDLQSQFDKCLKIEKRISSKGTDVSRLLRHLKTKIRLAIREEDDLLFDQFLEVYLHIFGMGIDLPAPPSDSPIPELFSGWNVIATIIFHLREVIDVAAQSQNDHFIRQLAFQLSVVVEAIIKHSDTYVSESSRDILGLFAAIYFYSRQHHNQTGITRSFSYLTGDVVDQAWIGKFEAVYTNQDAVDNLERILSYILQVLTNIVQSMLEYHDLDNLKILLNRLQLDEFLSPAPPVWQQLDHERWELRWKLRTANQEEINELTNQLNVCNSALNTRQEVGDLFNELVFVAASYIVDRYSYGEIDSTQTKKVLGVLEPYLVPFNQFTIVFSNLIKSEGWAWRSFHRRHPDTKHAYFPDDEAKFYLFYCLHGIALLSSGEISDETPAPSVDLKHQLSRIEGFCHTIANNTDKWSLIFEGVQDIPALANQFFELNQEIAENWQRNRDEQVINAELDPVKVSAFHEAFRKAFSSTPNLRTLLEAHGRVSYDVKIPGKKVLRINEWGEGKEQFTCLSSHSDYAEQLGSRYGRGLAMSENNLLVNEWLRIAKTLPSRKDWQSLEPYLDRSISYLHTSGYTADLIIIPGGLIHTVLQQIPDFRSVHDTISPPQLPNLHGFFNKIPILNWPGILDDRILVIDTTKATQFEVEYMEAEIKLLPKDEIRRILEKNSAYNERKLQLCIWVLISEKARVKTLDKNAAVKLLLKLPENQWLGWRKKQKRANELQSNS